MNVVNVVIFVVNMLIYYRYQNTQGHGPCTHYTNGYDSDGSDNMTVCYCRQFIWKAFIYG
jgi:hypothetical protein